MSASASKRAPRSSEEKSRRQVRALTELLFLLDEHAYYTVIQYDDGVDEKYPIKISSSKNDGALCNVEYIVQGSHGDKNYKVLLFSQVSNPSQEWTCSCEDFQIYRKQATNVCKHIYFVVLQVLECQGKIGKTRQERWNKAEARVLQQIVDGPAPRSQLTVGDERRFALRKMQKAKQEAKQKAKIAKAKQKRIDNA